MANEPLFIQIATFRLRHTADHNGCAYTRKFGVEVKLSVNDQAVEPLAAILGIDATFSVTLAPNDRLRISIDPKDPDFHKIEGRFVHVEGGRFERAEDTPIARAEFPHPQGFDVLEFGPARLTLVVFQAYVSPLRDATDRARKVIKDQIMQKSRIPDIDIIEKLEKAEDVHVVDFSPVDSPGAGLRFTKRRVDPAASVRCFEIASAKVPKAMVTSWPKGVQPVFPEIDDGSDRLSILMMLHPFLGGYYAADPYPFGVRHLWDAGLKYMGYRTIDPIISQYSESERKLGYRKGPRDLVIDVLALYNEEMGMPHQVAAAGKRAAVVMPINHGASIGKFNDANFAHTILHEFYAWGLRSEEMYLDPVNLGRSAVGGFSSGNQIMAGFLNANAGKVFCDEIIREVYSMDPPPLTKAIDQISDAANRWLKRGPADKKFRMYSQEPDHATFRQFKRQPTDRTPRTPFVLPGDGGSTPD
ncbi:MAG: hypothetical protein ACRD68_12145, partial [Pyrinomonadaceae bacterium]